MAELVGNHDNQGGGRRPTRPGMSDGAAASDRPILPGICPRHNFPRILLSLRFSRFFFYIHFLAPEGLIFSGERAIFGVLIVCIIIHCYCVYLMLCIYIFGLKASLPV